MNKKFVDRLTEYLNSECDDYDLKYDYRWEEDLDCCEVEITREYYQESKTLYFRYDYEKDNLSIELSEDCFYETKEFDWSVKYFWMLVSPALFPAN